MYFLLFFVFVFYCILKMIKKISNILKFKFYKLYKEKFIVFKVYLYFDEKKLCILVCFFSYKLLMVVFS